MGVETAVRSSSACSVEEALGALLRGARPVNEIESIDTHAALGRVLAEDLQAPIDLPSFDNAAVDGYAIAASDSAKVLADGLMVSGRHAAGTDAGSLPPGCAARVFTGACLPSGADRVVMQEDCAVSGGKIRLLRPVPVNDNIRRRGEDLRSGDLALPRGHRLRPQDLALAAALGLPKLSVHRRLRVAVLCTGSELVAPGEVQRGGQIYDANGALLAGLLSAQGCLVASLERVTDELDSTIDALIRLANAADVVITSGGVSVGEEDHIKAAVARCGQVDLWKVAIKPGKPFAFGSVKGKPLLGLPGNPVSALVTFCILVRPFLRRLQGMDEVLPTPLPFPARFSRAAGRRREYLRVKVEGRGDEAGLVLCGPQGSGMLATAVRAHGLAVVREDRGVREGEWLDYYPFDHLLS